MRNSLFAILLLCSVTGASALARSQAGRTDCIPYDPATLRLLEEPRPQGSTWVLERADGARLRLFATCEDAEAGLTVYKQHTFQCYIGRGNKYGRNYVMEYLR